MEEDFETTFFFSFSSFDNAKMYSLEIVFEQNTNVRARDLKPVWPDLAKFCNFGETLKDLDNLMRAYFVFGKFLSLLWQKNYAIRQSFIAVDGQILKHNLAIWSHCLKQTLAKKEKDGFEQIH